MVKIHDYLKKPKNWDEKTARKENNGCGTFGWKGLLVPDTIYTLNIQAACLIHDFDYFIGVSRRDKRVADNRFLDNINLLITNQSTWRSSFLNPLRRIRAKSYYMAVHFGGDDAFFDGKVKV